MAVKQALTALKSTNNVPYATFVRRAEVTWSVMVRLDEIRPSVWDSTIEVMEDVLKDMEFDGDDIVYSWRKDASMKRLERELFEKYGFLKDIILHPTFQSWKQWLDDVWDRHTPSLEVTLGDPLMPLVTIIVVMSLMHKRVPNDLLVLSGGLLFNVNPIYVVLGTIAFHWITKILRPMPKQYVKGEVRSRKKSVDTPDEGRQVAYADSQLAHEPTTVDGLASNLFDHVLIGGDVSTLFTAALLSKVGHRCCVLNPEGSSPTSVCTAEAPCTIPLENLLVTKPERYQALLDLVQKDLHQSTRVYLVPAGTEEEGYAHTLVRPLPLGSSVENSGNHSPSWKQAMSAPLSLLDVWSVRPSLWAFVSDLASRFLVDGTAMIDFLEKIALQQIYVTSFLVNRGFPAAVQQPVTSTGGLVKGEAEKAFESVSLQSVSDLLNSTGLAPDMPATHVMLGAVLSAVDELGLSPAEASGTTLAHAVSGMSSGTFYPRGGVVALEKMLTTVIQRAGGLIVKDVPVQEIVIEPTTAEKEDSTTEETNSLGQFMADRVVLGDGHNVYADKTIISGMGIIGTHANYLFGQESDHIGPQSLSALKRRVFQTTLADLKEASPVTKAVFWLSGSGSGTGADERGTMPSAVDYVEYHTGMSPDGASVTGSSNGTGMPFLRVWSPSAKDPLWKERCPDIHAVVMEYESTEPYISPRVLTGTGVPRGTDAEAKGPTVFLRRSEDIYMTDQYKAEFLKHARRKLQMLYPHAAQDTNIISMCCVSPGRHEGQRLSNTIFKYSKPLSACSELQNLYFCGRDVATIGLGADLQGAFVAVNAALGYDLTDKANMRNVISDLKNT